MLRVRPWVLGAFAALGVGVWWFCAAGLSEPAFSVPDGPSSGAAPKEQPAAASSDPSTSASPPVPPNIWAGVHPPPGAATDDPLKRHYRVSAQDVARVQRALNGGDPAQALQAAQLLKRCAHSDREVQELFEARDQQPWILSKLGLASGLDKMIENAQAFQRDCQAFDAATHAHTGGLFQRAYAGAAANSALSYLRWLQREGADAPPAALMAELQRQIRAEAEAAELGTLMAVALTQDPQALGLNPADKAGFERAWQLTQEADLGREQADQAWGRVRSLMRLMGEPPPELTPAQEAQAEALAQRVLAAHQRRKRALR